MVCGVVFLMWHVSHSVKSWTDYAIPSIEECLFFVDLSTSRRSRPSNCLTVVDDHGGNLTVRVQMARPCHLLVWHSILMLEAYVLHCFFSSSMGQTITGHFTLVWLIWLFLVLSSVTTALSVGGHIYDSEPRKSVEDSVLTCHLCCRRVTVIVTVTMTVCPWGGLRRQWWPSWVTLCVTWHGTRLTDFWHCWTRLTSQRRSQCQVCHSSQLYL